MTPETVQTGKHDATGGIIIVKDNGDLVCYHVYNKNEFEDYLDNHTKLEQAATSEDDILYFKRRPLKTKFAHENHIPYFWTKLVRT